MTEPGANGLYFGNISASNWHLSERPLLFVLAPVPASQGLPNASPTPRVTVLTPEFEATRAKLLSVPTSGDFEYLEWPEDANPFKVLADNISSRSEIKTIYVDEMMRAFVWKGLSDAFPNASVRIASPAIRSIRERKTAAEVELMKCANEVCSLRKIATAA